MGRETPVAFTLDGAVLARPTKVTRRKDSPINWERVIALGVNLLLWAVLIVAVRHLIGGTR